MKQETIPIFFAVDDKYIPFLAVALQSIFTHASKHYQYEVKILHTNVKEENKEKIKKYEKDYIHIEFVDVNYYIDEVKDKLYTRDYYTKTTYFRLFIPELYPEYDKVLYLDSDIVVLSDISELFYTDLGNNLIAAAPDDVIQTIETFQEYAEKVVGVVRYQNYFNAGILLMNLKELRNFKFQEKFLYLLETIKFSVAQDQDYLNHLCKGRVTLFENTWNRMPIGGDTVKREKLHLIHYNLSYKPWHFENILYEEYFWEYAPKTEFLEEINEIKANYSKEEKARDLEAYDKLVALAQKESSCVGDDRMHKKETKKTVEQSKERLAILKKIEIFEKEGKFDIDVEDDPPTIPLAPEHVDYLKTKSTSKLKAIFANRLAEKFVEELLKDKKLVIKEVKGLENLSNLTTGAIITCNHFNPYDCFTVETVFRRTKHAKNKTLYKVIREGNYTNFSGFYGFLFRNCDTLPLSSNKKTMKAFIKAVDTILQRGDFILMYPEQSMWWNYRKPKPLKDGAYNMAVKNHVPVLPIFITMEDSDRLDENGFYVQEYTVHIGEPIYPSKNVLAKKNIENMRKQNYQVWKEVYEEFYHMPLEYTTKKEEIGVL